MNEAIGENEIRSKKGSEFQKPYWKRMHRSFGFWITVFLMFIAIMYYILSVDFAYAPSTQSKQTPESKMVP
jgi:hypothetical protein